MKQQAVRNRERARVIWAATYQRLPNKTDPTSSCCTGSLGKPLSKTIGDTAAILVIAAARSGTPFSSTLQLADCSLQFVPWT